MVPISAIPTATSCAPSGSARREPGGSGRRGLTSNLDIVAAEVRTRNRDLYLSALYAPADVRPALMALWGLDLELGEVVAGTTEPMIGAIRLAWWREALVGLDAGAVPAQPLLALLAAEVLPRGVAGCELAGIEDRWAELVGADAVASDAAAALPVAHVTGGGLVFALAARLIGSDAAIAGRLGQAWVLGEAADLPPIPTPLRPLLGLVRLSQRDAARARAGRRREPRGSAGRQLRLLAAVAFGR